MMRHLIAQATEKYEDRAAKLNNVTPNELIAGDFFAFLAPYNEGIKKNEKQLSMSSLLLYSLIKAEGII